MAERNCLYVLDWRVNECFFFSVCEQAAEFSKSCNLIGFVILYELLCRSCSFPPLLILGFTSKSRPVLKWYRLLYLEFSLHNNWPFFFSFIRRPAITQEWKKEAKQNKRSERGTSGKKDKLVYPTYHTPLLNKCVYYYYFLAPYFLAVSQSDFDLFANLLFPYYFPSLNLCCVF